MFLLLYSIAQSGFDRLAWRLIPLACRAVIRSTVCAEPKLSSTNLTVFIELERI